MSKCLFKYHYYDQNNINIIENSLFIIGLASHGNLGQLVVDSLLATAHSLDKLEFTGYIESNLVLPMTGYECFNHNDTKKRKQFLCMPLELYHIITPEGQKPIYVILQRSPCVKGANRLLASSLVNSLKDKLVSNVLLVTGASVDDIELDPMNRIFAYYNESIDMISHYPKLINYLNQLPFLNLPDVEIPISKQNQLAIRSIIFNEESTPPFGMLTTKNVLKVNSTIQLPVYILGKFILEGENMYDGIELASSLCFNLGITEKILVTGEMSIPESWNKLLSRERYNDMYM